MKFRFFVLASFSRCSHSSGKLRRRRLIRAASWSRRSSSPIRTRSFRENHSPLVCFCAWSRTGTPIGNFPGDAGIPTEIKWTLPAGWKVGEIQWPIPLKIERAGRHSDLRIHDEVLLMQEITPPASVSGLQCETRRRRELACLRKDLCIPGSANLQLSLPVAAKSAPANAGALLRAIGARCRRIGRRQRSRVIVAGSESELICRSRSRARRSRIIHPRFLTRCPEGTSLSAIRKSSAALMGNDVSGSA